MLRKAVHGMDPFQENEDECEVLQLLASSIAHSVLECMNVSWLTASLSRGLHCTERLAVATIQRWRLTILQV